MLSLLWRFRGTRRPYRGLLVLGGVVVLVVAALELALPWPLKVVVDDVLRDRAAGGEVGALLGPLAASPYTVLGVAAAALVLLAALAAVGEHAGAGAPS
jgi:ATP-binding cassette subfamily B protein